MMNMRKSRARKAAKASRARVIARAEKAVALCGHFPWEDFKHCRFAGFWPLHDEIDLRPLMIALQNQGASMSLPVTGAVGTALSFRAWNGEMSLQSGRFGTMHPPASSVEVTPDFIFLPLLAFGPKGERLGYGGGYYDRTVIDLRKNGKVFTCGVGFDAQETSKIPMQSHDVRLEAILTPSGFRRFS